MTRFVRFLPIVAFVSLFSCATPPANLAGKALPELRNELCSARSAEISAVRGTVWVKLESKAGSGQFPANILVDANGATIEVTDLVGGEVGVLRSTGGKFAYQGRGATAPTILEILKRQSLLGLKPDEFNAVFFGRLPCFASAGAGRLSGDSVLYPVGPTSADTERFEVTERGTRNLVRTFEARGLRFEASDYQDPYGLPKVWTIHSKLGNAVIRWKDRDVVPKTP